MGGLDEQENEWKRKARELEEMQERDEEISGLKKSVGALTAEPRVWAARYFYRNCERRDRLQRATKRIQALNLENRELTGALENCIKERDRLAEEWTEAKGNAMQKGARIKVLEEMLLAEQRNSKNWNESFRHLQKMMKESENRRRRLARKKGKK